MRPGNNARRPRGRPNRKQHGPPRAHTFDSHGPDVRIRGNAPQIYDKYVTLARDAAASGDRIAAEGYYQFAEHYFRIMNDSTDPRRPAQQPARGDQQQPARGDQQQAARSDQQQATRSDQQQPLAEPAPPPPQQEQPQVEWPQQLDAAIGEAPVSNEAPKDVSNAPPAAAEDEKPRRQPKGRPRGRRRSANGAKDPTEEPAAKTDGKSDGKTAAINGEADESGPAEGPKESTTPST